MLIYTQVYNSEVTLSDWNLLSNFSDSESSGLLTGIQKNNIFSAGLDMMQISQYVDIFKFTILRLLSD